MHAVSCAHRRVARGPAGRSRCSLLVLSVQRVAIRYFSREQSVALLMFWNSFSARSFFLLSCSITSSRLSLLGTSSSSDSNLSLTTGTGEDTLRVSTLAGGALEATYRNASYLITSAVSYPNASPLSDGQWNQLNASVQARRALDWHVSMVRAGPNALVVVGRANKTYTMRRYVEASADPPRLTISDSFENLRASDLGLSIVTRVHAASLSQTRRCATQQLWSHNYPDSPISTCIHVAGMYLLQSIYMYIPPSACVSVCVSSEICASLCLSLCVSLCCSVSMRCTYIARGRYNTTDQRNNYHLAEPAHPSWNPSWWIEGPQADGGGGLGVVVVSERHRLGLDMSLSAGYDAVLHTPGLGVPAGTSSHNNSWVLLPVRSDYWEMINTARGLLTKPQTLHARLGFMNWGQITTMQRDKLVEYIRQRGMRQIVVMGPFSGSPWVGMYGQYLYEPALHIPAPYSNESFDVAKRIEACAILHSIERELGDQIDCLAPFELALTPDLPPGTRQPHFSSHGVVATSPEGMAAIMSNWGPCTAWNDSSAACEQYVQTHGRSLIYIVDAEPLASNASGGGQNECRLRSRSLCI